MPDGVVALSLHKFIEKQGNECFDSSLLECKDLHCKIILKMDGENFSETMVTTYNGRSCHIPDSYNHKKKCSKNLIIMILKMKWIY